MQAFLIAAYKDEPQLIRLIEGLCNNAKVFVHINALSKIDIDKLKNMHFPNTVFIKKYKISWGSFTHLQAILYLLKIASLDKDVSYVHVVSGQDCRIKSIRYIEETFSNNRNIYMSTSNVNDGQQHIKERYLYRHYISKKNTSNIFWNKIDSYAIILQKKFNLRRKKIGPFNDVYKGMVWISAPIEVIIYILDFIKSNKKFMRDLRHTFIPEEIFFQTIIMNSKYREDVRSLGFTRYMVWEKRNGSSPAYLDASDINKVVNSDSIFARKVDSEISSEFIEYFKDLN